jgi:hypothetical protein
VVGDVAGVSILWFCNESQSEDSASDEGVFEPDDSEDGGSDEEMLLMGEPPGGENFAGRRVVLLVFMNHPSLFLGRS